LGLRHLGWNNYAEVTVCSEAGKELARGLVTVSVSGARELDSP
jgi:hypothetical protein